LELLGPGTAIEGAALSIRQPPAVSRCRTCGAETEIDDMVSDCPRCHSPEIAIERGREMLLESIELED
jgi:hydrogenase nickel incorporation protein HypA/HybF